MKLKKKGTILTIGCCVLAGALIAGSLAVSMSTDKKEDSSLLSIGKENLYLWYTDDAMTDYLNSVAVNYNEKYHVRVTPVLKSGKEFLEAVNKASLEKAKDAPDLYLTTNDTIEKATLSGLASQIRDQGKTVTTQNYPQSALSAVTYQGKLMAYPIYYDTSVLLYNETYLADYAKAQLEAAKDQADGEAAMETAAAASSEAAAGTETSGTEASGTEASGTETSEFSKDQIADQITQYLPSTIENLEAFADTYDAPQEVQNVFKWDVADILYNYNFVGNYMNIGGESGDDEKQIDIYNANTIQCLNVFQKLNQFFSIDVKTVNYQNVMEDFESGKIVFTVAGTDAVKELETAKADGTMPYDYGVLTMPDLTDTLKSRSLSITTGLVVNGYSGKKDAANQFAAYMATKDCDDIYSMAGKASANLNAKVPYDALSVYMQEYADSIPMPKLMSTSNLWMKLEIGFTDIWNGADANAELKSIAENTISQVTGETVSEEPITIETQSTTEAQDTTETQSTAQTQDTADAQSTSQAAGNE